MDFYWEEGRIRPERQSLLVKSRQEMEFPSDNSSTILMKKWLKKIWLREAKRDVGAPGNLWEETNSTSTGDSTLQGGSSHLTETMQLLPETSTEVGRTLRKKYPDLCLLQSSILPPLPPSHQTQPKDRGHESRPEKVGERIWEWGQTNSPLGE